MPELAEIHSYSRNINNWVSGKTFTKIIKLPTGKGPDISFSIDGDFSIFSQARGKELMLVLTPKKNPSNPLSVTFRHGLVGIWNWALVKSIPKHTHIYFATDSHALCYVDSNRLGTWNKGSFDTVSRGPDPINDFNNFRKHVFGHKNSNSFNKPICEVLLDQKLFNGIGNYLRAEILYRACINPHVNAKELFSVNPEAANRLIALTRNVPLEVFTLKLNKYGTPKEKQEFKAWLKVYGKSKFDVVKGRKIYYQSNQHLLQPDSSMVIPLSFNTSQNNIKKREVDNNGPKRKFCTKPREKNIKRLLLATSLLHQSGLISPNEKNWIKNSAFKGEDLVFIALEAFDGDASKDVKEFADTIKIMYEMANNPIDSAIYC